MKTFRLIAVAVIGFALWAGLAAQAQESYTWKQYDTESPFLIKYSGTGAATVTVVTAGNTTISDDGNETSIDTTNTIADVMALINAVTNAAGVKNFSTKLWGGLAADTCTLKMLTAAATVLTKNEWSNVMKWDVSVGLTADVVVSQLIGDQVKTPRLLTGIYGDPIGTGNVTARVYNGGSLVWQKTFTSPTYVWPATLLTGGTNINTNTLAADAVVHVNEPVNIRLSADKVAFVRLTRATTCTTTLGGVGAAYKD